MEIVRSLDENHDFLFGQGINDYRAGLNAVAQDIQCNILMFLGDCFFATNQGIDWFNLMGQPGTELAVTLNVNTAILNTLGVTGILTSSAVLTRDRALQVTYSVNTVYGTLTSSLQYSLGLAG
jgi:hypothetical protein